MGIYLHAGMAGPHILLRELITHQKLRAHSASGYLGRSGEIWFARILPTPFHDERFDYAVVFTTPYIAGELKDKQTYSRTTEAEWMAYFERNLDPNGFENQTLAYANDTKADESSAAAATRHRARFKAPLLLSS